jgi:hypothetical protein
MNLVWLLILVLVILMLVGTPYTGLHPYGFWPSGSIGVVLLVLVILLLLGYL